MNLKKFKKIENKKKKSIIVNHTCPYCNKDNLFRLDRRNKEHTSATEVKICHFCKKILAFNVDFDYDEFGISFSTKTINCAHCEKPIQDFKNVLLYFNNELGDESTGGFVHKGKCEEEVDKLISLGIDFYKNLKKGPYLNLELLGFFGE